MRNKGKRLEGNTFRQEKRKSGKIKMLDIFLQLYREPEQHTGCCKNNDFRDPKNQDKADSKANEKFT